MERNKNYSDEFSLFWNIFVLFGGLFVLLSFTFTMPYTPLVKDYLTTWMSHIIVLAFGVSLVVSLYFKKQSKLTHLFGLTLIISGLLLQPSIQKSPFVNKIIFLVFMVVALLQIIVISDNPKNRQKGTSEI
jgi:hypothetical protein